MTAVFPALPGLDIAVRRSVLTSTGTQSATTGKEQRVSWWSTPKYEFELTFNALRQLTGNFTVAQDEAQVLSNFFLAQLGQFSTFLFADPINSTATAVNFGTGNGTNTAFQLVDLAGVSVVQNGAPAIYVNGVLQVLTTNYTISSTGLVTFVTAPLAGQACTWTGSYYYTVRVAQDQLDYEQIVVGAWECKSLILRTVK